MELFWTPEAAQDRDEIYAYIEADNPVAAMALDEVLAEKASRFSIIPAWGDLAGLPARTSWSRTKITSLFTTRLRTWCGCCVYCMLPGVGRRAISPRPEASP